MQLNSGRTLRQDTYEGYLGALVYNVVDIMFKAYV